MRLDQLPTLRVNPSEHRQPGSTAVTLSGSVGDEQQTYRFPEQSFDAETSRLSGAAALPRLWATRKIGYLLNEIRLHGESQELVDEIVELSIRYGIITPYTSFLVEEPLRALSREGREDIADETFRELSAAPAAPAVGGQAVEKAQAQAEMEAAEAPAGPAEAYAQQVQVVGDRAFVLKDGVWTDTTFIRPAWTRSNSPSRPMPSSTC